MNNTNQQQNQHNTVSTNVQPGNPLPQSNNNDIPTLPVSSPTDPYPPGRIPEVSPVMISDEEIPAGLGFLNPSVYRGLKDVWETLSKVYKSVLSSAKKAPQQINVRQQHSGYQQTVQSQQPHPHPAPIQQQPVQTPEMPAATQTSSQNVFTNDLPKRNTHSLIIVFPIIVIVVALAGVGYIAYSVLSGKGTPLINLGNETPTAIPTASPTPILINTIQPSVYADDEVILLLEEQINTLDGELSTTVLRESTLNPPSLDFNISF